MLALAAVACEDPPRAASAGDAGDAALPPPPPAREGCARVGSFDAVEADTSCVVKQASEDAMRGVWKQLSVTLDAEPPEVMTGGTATLVLTVKNVSSSDVALVLEAKPRAAGPRTDWSRVAGVPEPRPGALEIPRLLFPTVTTDLMNRDVDALPTVSANGAQPTPTLLLVRLRPSGKLTRTASWWALRIPAPPPVVVDDAGHRFYPKTTALNLSPGEYTVTVELPFFGLTREERKVTTRIRVTRATFPDGGVRPFD